MKRNEKKGPNPSLIYLQKVVDIDPASLSFIPPGTEFSDIYMDTREVAAELKVSLPSVTKLRKAGKLSYSRIAPRCKILYLRREIEAMLKANVVIGK